ncbi:HEAT repeat domain-containing protein [Candidatus Micrarchaeota archaeon]|nr:HEAT repeat domain-containing protein [Candidatus Micrarchaeota archaeon]
MDAAQNDLNKLVSLTFDENPQVRLRAAESLGQVDDPAAIFALIELSYDKQTDVRKRVQEILDKKKKEEADVMSFAEIFSRATKKDKEAKKKEDEQPLLSKKEKILSPITNIFEKRLGKEKADRVKAMMMPTIEKIYKNASIRGRITSEQHGKEVIQEFLTNYLEAVSGINEEAVHESVAEQAEAGEAMAMGEKPLQEAGPVPEPPAHESVEMPLDEVGTKERKTDRLSTEIMEVDADDYAEIKEESEAEKSLPHSFFQKAYEAMMLSNGDEDVMQSEMKRMLTDADKDIKLAFRVAREKFKERKVTDITKITNGMRNINTEILFVKEVESISYNKTAKQVATATRAMVADETGNEGVLYLFDDRGGWLKPQMRIKIVKGYAKTFNFSGETALTVGRKGNVYIVL